MIFHGNRRLHDDDQGGDMAKLHVGTFVTIDGVMQAPGGPDEDRDSGFEHGGWSFHYWDDGMGEKITEATLRADALVLGRRTYEIFAAYWPNQSGDEPVAAKLNSVPKYIASRTLDEVTWNNSRLLEGDAAKAVAKLKDELDGEIQVTGSANLLQSLIKADLVDGFQLWVFPLVLGKGKRLFADGAVPGAFKLVDSQTSSTGVAINTYERGGEIQYGSF
jgi:dihydrofolate reductase